jgi:tryptophan synthase beta subunit
MEQTRSLSVGLHFHVFSPEFHLIHDTSQQQYRWTIPEAVNSYVLLVMGEGIARNM